MEEWINPKYAEAIGNFETAHGPIRYPRLPAETREDPCQHCGGSGWIGDIKCPACG